MKITSKTARISVRNVNEFLYVLEHCSGEVIWTVQATSETCTNNLHCCVVQTDMCSGISVKKICVKNDPMKFIATVQAQLDLYVGAGLVKVEDGWYA